MLWLSVDYKRLIFPFAIEEFPTPALVQVPEFVTLPAEPAAVTPGAGAPHDIRDAEVTWPMPLSAPLVSGPDWGRERTRETRRG